MMLIGGPRRRASAAALALVTILGLGTWGAVHAMFTATATGGPQSLQTATLPTPSGLTTAAAACPGPGVKVSWTASSVLDPNESSPSDYLVTGYDLVRSATGLAGSYTALGQTSGEPPAATYTDPSLPQSVYVASGSGTDALSIATPGNTTKTVTTGTVGAEPNALAATPDGSKVILAEGPSSQVQVVSTSTGSVTGTVGIPGGSDPAAVAVSPDGSTAWVVDITNHRIYPITNLASSTPTLGTAISLGTKALADPTALLVTPDGKWVFTTGYTTHDVYAIDTSTDAVTTIAIKDTRGRTTGKPIALAATPNSGHVYVVDQQNNLVDDITTAGTPAVSKTISSSGFNFADGNLTTSGDPNIVGVSADGEHLFVASFSGSSVTDIDIFGAADTVTQTIALPTGAQPNALALTPDGCQVYVDDYANNAVDVITIGSPDTLGSALSLGSGACTNDPVGMSVSPDSTHVYVSDFYNTAGCTPQVSSIATSANTVTSVSVPSTSTPSGLVITATPYHYEVSATHGGWASASSSSVTYSGGWDPGLWQ